MALYKVKNGQRVKLSNREVKAYIMKQNNWDATQYKKQYDIFKNKLRAFEAYESYYGKDVKKASASELLYKEAKAKQHYGSEYKPSLTLQRIKSFTSVSSGKVGQQKLQSERYMKARTISYESNLQAFDNFLNAIPESMREKLMSIENPVKREQAIKDYADKLHAKQDAQSRAIKAEAIPISGEVMGSDVAIDFDISEYM